MTDGGRGTDAMRTERQKNREIEGVREKNRAGRGKETEREREREREGERKRPVPPSFGYNVLT